jgi:hypothetical protein
MNYKTGKILFTTEIRKAAGHWWLTPVILATWEAEIRGIPF